MALPASRGFVKLVEVDVVELLDCLAHHEVEDHGEPAVNGVLGL